ncbi:MAG TPA: 3-hydroxybutyryl-CoA dehydrogenase [Gemmatimonadales bacterium]|nr:3-hydroxybutyryl-CoA dehydrogenase [Gemmatimonadales bacterium]
MTKITRVGVVGCGLMGSGIAQAAATAGFDTIVRDVAEPLLERGRSGIIKSLGRLVERGKIPAETREAALGRLRFVTQLSQLGECDIVIEAVTEDLELKNAVWHELDRVCGPKTIFASNTSSLTISSMADSTSRADRFVGLHFFNPVPMMPLVEVVRTGTTSRETLERAFTFAKALGKEPVASVDRPGFIVNLLLVPFLLDAVRALERGTATTRDIDRAMQLGCGHPMGPLSLLDFIGLDTVVRIGDIMLGAYQEDRYGAPALLRRMVAAGHHGKKSGKGFYDYSTDPPVPMGVGSQESRVGS